MTHSPKSASTSDTTDYAPMSVRECLSDGAGVADRTERASGTWFFVDPSAGLEIFAGRHAQEGGAC